MIRITMRKGPGNKSTQHSNNQPQTELHDGQQQHRLCPSTLTGELKERAACHSRKKNTVHLSVITFLFTLQNLMPASFTHVTSHDLFIQPLRASLPPSQNKSHLTAAHSLYCVWWLLCYCKDSFGLGNNHCWTIDECVWVWAEVMFSSYPDSPHGCNDLHPAVGPGHVQTPDVLW